MQPLLHSPPKANTTADSTPFRESEVPPFDSPFLWSSNTGREVNVMPFDYMPEGVSTELQPSESFLFCYKKKARNSTALLYSFAYLAKNP